MALFLSILKIIGIVLLVVLGVVLVLLLLILFVPIRYRIDGNVKETDLENEVDKLKENVSGIVKFSWLLHFVSGGISYPEDPEFKVKVLCFTVFPPKNKKSDDETDIDEDYEIDTSESSANTSGDTITEKESGFDEPSEDTDTIEDESEEQKEPSQSEESESEVLEEDEFDEDDESFLDFLKNILDTINRIIKVPQDVFSKIQYTTSRICDKINMVKNTLSNDIFKRAFEVTKKQLIRVLKMIIPRKFRMDILLGLGDPTLTADIMAGYGVLYPILVNKVFLIPDFERQIVKGEAHIKGRVTVFTLLHAAAILYFNKDVKKTIRRFNKIINS
ncbi:hypothetical protein [Butyrivibrio sp. VCD2006]|uniref:hypothetical protein n=1 Tax=Butyrivibrio sp. VCD2006 TaxID=1280664 RepID=UPI0003F5C9D8|nr:hypothetical protein [Butyrivibrio sp. VCD2006]